MRYRAQRSVALLGPGHLVTVLCVMLTLCAWVVGTVPSRAAGLNVKVLEVDHDTREATLLLPMHNSTLGVKLADEEPELLVRPSVFYRAVLSRPGVKPARKNVLRVKVPERAKPVRFLIHTVNFLGGRR